MSAVLIRAMPTKTASGDAPLYFFSNSQFPDHETFPALSTARGAITICAFLAPLGLPPAAGGSWPGSWPQVPGEAAGDLGSCSGGWSSLLAIHHQQLLPLSGQFCITNAPFALFFPPLCYHGADVIIWLS